MREENRSQLFVDYSDILGMPSSGSYYEHQKWYDHLKELAQIYDVTIITGIQKPKFTLGRLKPLNIV